MKPVFQTRFDDLGTGPGNCMQAAAASFLDLPLDAVPNFIMQAGDPEERMRAFFKLHGYDLVNRPSDFVPRGYYFETGISTQGYEHIVICQEGRLVHDPNPHGRGLVMRDGVLWPKVS